MDSQQIGGLIAALRKELNLTQQELADRLGVTNKAVSKWERGDGLPDISLMTSLADALHITADELLRGERRPPAEENAGLKENPKSREENEEYEKQEEQERQEKTISFEEIGMTRVFDGRRPEAGEEEPDVAERPFYRRKWFLPVCTGGGVLLLLLVLFVLLFLFLPEKPSGQGEDASSDSPLPGISRNSTEATGRTTESASSMSAASVPTVSLARTTTTEAVVPTTTATLPTVPPSPPSPSNPPLPGTGIVPQAGHAILFNATEGRVVYGYGYEERCSSASLTKLLTAVAALEYAKPETVFTVGEELDLVQEDSSTAYLKKGQQLKRDTLLHAMLLESGNDAAYVLAAGIGRTEAGDSSLSPQAAIDVFCGLMNQRAKTLGAVSSHFTNPDGFDDASHYATPMDILTIARYAYGLPEIRNAVSRASIRDVFVSGEDVTWKNTNRLIRQGDPYYYPGATGMKTGYTSGAGDCLVATAERNGVTLFAVVMDAPNDDARWKDAAALLDAGFGAGA